MKRYPVDMALMIATLAAAFPHLARNEDAPSTDRTKPDPERLAKAEKKRASTQVS